MIKFSSFAPDLIVEVTQACDRACTGCYAPNLIVSKSNRDRGRDADGDGRADLIRPSDLNLRPSVLEDSIMQVPPEARSASIRGGEPSLHPELHSLIQCLGRRFDRVWLETHGRWLLGDSQSHLLQALRDERINVKISFDSMHGLSPALLQQMTDKLGTFGVRYSLAVTEQNEEIAAQYLASIPELVVGRATEVYFQLKASDPAALYVPPFGVINTKGSIKVSVTSKEAEGVKAKNLRPARRSEVAHA